MNNSTQPWLAISATCTEVGKERVTRLVVHELGGAVLLVGDVFPGPYALDFWGRGNPELCALGRGH